jgi:hypothetical protein
VPPLAADAARAIDERAIAQADAKWREAVDASGWNHVFIRAIGDRYLMELNGLTTVDARAEGVHRRLQQCLSYVDLR